MEGDTLKSEEKEHLLLITDVFRPVITVYLNVEPVLLTFLQLNGLITPATATEINKLQSQRSNEAAVEYLLRNINITDAAGNDYNQYSKFLSSLRSSTDEGNQDLADHIEGLKDLPALRDQRQQFCCILKDLHPYLIESMKPREILPHLGQFLSKADREEIEAREREHGAPHAAFSMLLLLQRSGSDWHRHFVTACREVGLEDEADTLELTLEKCKADKTTPGQTPVPDDNLSSDDGNAAKKDGSSQNSSDRIVEFPVSGHKGNDRGFPSQFNNFHQNQRPCNQRQDGFNDINLNIPSKEKTTCQSALNLSSFNSAMFDSVEGEENDESTLYNSLRTYQRELAEPAVRGLNTVLIAPTGTGKTHVAAFIIDRHIKRFKAEGKTAKVVFIVHTKILAAQQQKKIEELLQEEQDLMIVEATGENLDSPLTEVINISDVVVLTAQVLLNGLTEGNDVVDLRDLTLMIFDECHNCQKAHPYKKIMDVYHHEKRKLRGEGATSWTVPQIVGMTASIGTGNAKSTEKAKDHAFEIFANLDAKMVHTVENIEDLEKYQNIPEEIDPHIVPAREKDPFRDVLQNIMAKLERFLQKQLEPFERNGLIGEVEAKCNGARDSQVYENWVIKLQRECVKVMPDTKGDLQEAVRSCLGNLLDYNRGLCLNRDVRTKDALNFLQQRFQQKAQRAGTCNDRLVKLFHENLELLRTLSDNASENPVLKRLKELIVMEYKKRPSSRALLFTPTIQSTIALKEWLDETPLFEELELNAGRVTGAADLTAAERNNTIRKFRSGEHKVIVATNVVEQGMDIAECNLVFRLNYVPSDTGHIQVKGRMSFGVSRGQMISALEIALKHSIFKESHTPHVNDPYCKDDPCCFCRCQSLFGFTRGRNRAKGGKSYLVASSSFGNFRNRELNNKIRETMMTKLLEKIKEMPDEAFEMKILDHQEKAYRAHRREEERKRQRLAAGSHRNTGVEYHLRCVTCKTFACSSRDIFLVKGTYRVVDDESFKTERIEITKMGEPHVIKPNELAIGKISCAKCKQDWGGMILLDNESLIVITTHGFEMKNILTQEVDTYKSWSKVPFLSPDM